jgi:hypothetical protein
MNNNTTQDLYIGKEKEKEKNKTTVKLIPYSDVLIQNNGGTLLIDLSENDKKKIVNKIKKQDFETDLEKIEHEEQQFKNKIGDNDESFSFDSFVLHEDKIIIKNQIKTLSILKMHNFDYSNSNRVNHAHYKTTINNKTLKEKYLRLWLYYSGREKTTLDIIINKYGELNNEYETNEIIYKLYEIKYNNYVTKSFTGNMDNILKTIFNHLINQYNKSKNKQIAQLSVQLCIIPLIFIYLIKYTKNKNNTISNLLETSYKYMNINEERGISSNTKKLAVGSVMAYHGYKKINNYITNVIDVYNKNEIAKPVFNDNIDASEKKEIIVHLEKMITIDTLVNNLSNKSISELFDIMNAIPKNRTEDINIFTNNLIETLKIEIKKTPQLNKKCSNFAKHFIQNKKTLPLFLFVDKDCELRTLKECICAFIICLLNMKDISIFKKDTQKGGKTMKKITKKKIKRN